MMNIAAELKVGDKLEIEMKEKKIIEEPLIVSQVVDIKGDKIFIVNPFQQGSAFPLYVGQIVKIIFYREEKGIFRFSAEIKGKIEKKLTIYEISPLNDIEKIQRRYFFRFDVVRRVELKLKGESDEYQGVTKDISGGGMKLTCKKPFEMGSIVECKIFLQDDEATPVVGEIVRAQFDPILREYILGVNFKDIQEATRNKIVSFIFERQRLLRKKGLI